MSSTVTEQLIYECFSEIYYQRIFKDYDDNQTSVTQCVQCLLKSFFERKLRRALMSSKIVILSFGNLVDESLAKPLEKRGFAYQKEGVLSTNGIELFAHGDHVRDDCGIEDKTITRMPFAPLLHHFQQASTYIPIFGTKEWFLNYVHKPSGTVKVFPIEYSEKSFQWVILRGVRLCYHLRTNVMPTPEPSWLCKYCEYTDLCPAMRGR